MKQQAATNKKWFVKVTKNRDVMDPKKIASSVKASAARSTRGKSSPKRSAMSMLLFYINRAGKDFPTGGKRRLEKAKKELRKLSQ
jgi:hypothetical protein